MARIKQTSRQTNLDDSFRAPLSELSDRPSGTPNTASDSVLSESGDEHQNEDSGSVEQAPHADARSESSGSDSLLSTLSRVFDDSEEKHSRKAREEILDKGLFKVDIQANRETREREFIPQSYIPKYNWLYNGTYLAACSLSVEEPRDKAMDKLSESKKAAAQYRSAILGKRPAEESLASQAPKATANLQVKADLEATKRRVSEQVQQVKDLKAKLEPLKEAEKEAEDLRTRVDKLKQRLANQEVQLAKKYTSRAKEEKQALVKDMMDDYNLGGQAEDGEEEEDKSSDPADGSDQEEEEDAEKE
ncbi:putative DNA helicase INO80 [Chenopodium quinoa]|uniref:putative DNA helicase INO80 n=1 Tax=Chenopodium quinoa TaxID=63459 RepID=UPI000B77609E|nr:putative DNA helicase INO80 [Chenopodium quinoa]